MKQWQKIIVGTGFGTALIAGATWLFRLQKSSAELEVVPSIQLHQLNLQGLTIRVNVQLKNPTRLSFLVKYPFIKLSYKGRNIGSSQVSNQNITIPAFGEAFISDILIRIPMLNLVSSAGKLLVALQNQEAIHLDVNIMTAIDIGIKKIPYEKSIRLTLKK